MVYPKITIRTNYGRIHDWLLGKYLSWVLRREKPETVNAIYNILKEELASMGLDVSKLKAYPQDS